MYKSTVQYVLSPYSETFSQDLHISICFFLPPDLSLVDEGNSEDELQPSLLTEDRLMESRNLESAATSQFGLSRTDQTSSIGAETDYGTEFPETPRTVTCTT